MNLNYFYFESEFYNLLKEQKTFQEVNLNKIEQG